MFFKNPNDAIEGSCIMGTFNNEARQTPLEIVQFIATDFRHRPIQRQYPTLLVENQDSIAGVIEKMGNQALAFFGRETLGHIPGHTGQPTGIIVLVVNRNPQEFEGMGFPPQIEPDQFANRLASSIDFQLPFPQTPRLFGWENVVDRFTQHLIHRQALVATEGLVHSQIAAIVVEQPGRIRNGIKQCPALTGFFHKSPRHLLGQRFSPPVALHPGTHQCDQRNQEYRNQYPVNDCPVLPLGQYIAFTQTDREYERKTLNCPESKDTRHPVQLTNAPKVAGSLAGCQGRHHRPTFEFLALPGRQLRPSGKEFLLAAPQGNHTKLSDIQTTVVALEIICTQGCQHDTDKIADLILETPCKNDDYIIGHTGNDRWRNDQPGRTIIAQFDEIRPVGDIDVGQYTCCIVQVAPLTIRDAKTVRFRKACQVALQLRFQLTTWRAFCHLMLKAQDKIHQMLVDLPRGALKMALQQFGQRTADMFGRMKIPVA